MKWNHLSHLNRKLTWTFKSLFCTILTIALYTQLFARYFYCAFWSPFEWMSQSGCWHLCVGTCWHKGRCRHGPTHSGAGMCRHIYVPKRANTWVFFESWDVLTCVDTWKVPTPEVLTHVGANNCDINHMDFIWMLGCARICQHLKRCLHLWRCRQVPARPNTSQHFPGTFQVLTHVRTF